jgi:hypothetical protein
MGHILENSPYNLAHALRAPPAGGGFFTQDSATPSSWSAFPVNQGGWQQPAQDPWQAPGGDPWAGAPNIPNAHPQQQYQPQQQWQPAASSNAAPPQQTQYDVRQQLIQQNMAWNEQTQEYYDSGTDSETESSFGEAINYNGTQFTGLTDPQIDEKLWWQYARAKSMWRKHMKKPVRRIRRFVRRKGKGYRKGRGKGRYNFASLMPDEEYDNIFFGGKGKSKGSRRTTGKGMGRKKNPIGSDGNVMTCSICNSEEHFRAVCPRANGQQAGYCSHINHSAPPGEGPLS